MATTMLTTYVVRVAVLLKPSVLDIQGQAITQALHTLGYDGVQGVRFGKAIDVTVAAQDAEQARHLVERMSEQLLANPIMEVFAVESVVALAPEVVAQSEEK